MVETDPVRDIWATGRRMGTSWGNTWETTFGYFIIGLFIGPVVCRSDWEDGNIAEDTEGVKHTEDHDQRGEEGIEPKIWLDKNIQGQDVAWN